MIHPHVKGAIQPKAESPLRHIQLRAAHPKVGQDQCNRVGRGVISEIGRHDRDAIPMLLKPLGRGQTGSFIVIEPQQTQLWIAIQQQTAVATTTQRRINEHA